MKHPPNGRALGLPSSEDSVLVASLTHLEERLPLGLDTLEHRRVRELELELVVCERLEPAMASCLGHSFNGSIEVTLVAPKLEPVEVQNVGDRVVEEARVVRDNIRCACRKAGQVCLKPCNVDDVQMVRWLVEEQYVGLEEHHMHRLHLPPIG